MKFPIKTAIVLILFVSAIAVTYLTIPATQPPSVKKDDNTNFNVNLSSTSTQRRRQIDVIKGVKSGSGKLSYNEPMFRLSFVYPETWGDLERQYVDFTTGTTKIVETPGGPVEESGKALILILIQKDPKTSFILELISPDYPFGSEGFPIPYRGEYDISKICDGQESLENLQECLVVEGRTILITRESDYAGGSWIRAYRNIDWMGFSGLSLMVLTSTNGEDEKKLIKELLDTLVLG